MSLSSKTKNLIWGQFAGKCAICRKSTIHENNSNKKSLYGEIAHIAGEKPNSARHNPNMSDEQRNHPDNLMLLCANHHTIIDKEENISEYSIEKLNNIKKEFLSWLNSRLINLQTEKIKIHYLFFINIPRLLEISLHNRQNLDLRFYQKNVPLHQQGFNFIYVMESARNLLTKLHIESINFKTIQYISEKYIGQLVYTEQIQFRTKNIFKRNYETNNQITGDLSKDPHIYHKHANGWKLIMLTNPDWITTSSGLTYFSPTGGVSNFTSLFRVTSIDFENNIMFASPIIVGLSPGPFDM